MNRLYDNLSILDGKEYLIVADIYHSSLDENSINNQLEEINTFSNFDKNIIYLIFSKDNIKERNLNDNVFAEDKLAYLHFIIGFALAKGITTYLFTGELNSTWLKIKDSKYENFLKFSEFEYLKITLEYMLREKRRNYEKEFGKQPSKLTMLLNNTKPVLKRTESKNSEISYPPVLNITESFNFKNLFENAKKFLIKSNPKNFQAVKNILLNLTEQKIKSFTNYEENELAFILLTELLNKGVIMNNILTELVNNKFITSFNDIESLLNFDIDTDIEINEDGENVNHKNKKRSKLPTEVFSLSSKSEEEYTKLLQNSPTICNFVKTIVAKILNSISLSTIDRMPSNPVKYKNFIYSYLNNQELKHIAKRILILDYDNLLNTLTEGIIIELMKNSLIIILSETKIFYNLVKIEQEKFRLSNK
jgi:hypothetical protein